MTYTTEAERVAAREVFVATWKALGISAVMDSFTAGQHFDRAFPPLAPVRMKPVREWRIVGPDGECRCSHATREAAAGCLEFWPCPGSRVAEVEVREVTDEPSVVLTLAEAKDVQRVLGLKHNWYHRALDAAISRAVPDAEGT